MISGLWSVVKFVLAAWVLYHLFAAFLFLVFVVSAGAI